MCYTEDIFHAKCNHWAAQPRVYHKCAAAKHSDFHFSCSAKKTTGSRREESLCKKCEFDSENSFEGKGMWLSISSKKEKILVKQRYRLRGTWAERPGAPDLKVNQRQPEGFLSGRMGL